MAHHLTALVVLLSLVVASVGYYVPGTYPQEFLSNDPLSGTYCPVCVLLAAPLTVCIDLLPLCPVHSRKSINSRHASLGGSAPHPYTQPHFCHSPPVRCCCRHFSGPTPRPKQTTNSPSKLPDVV